jgi:hypothetical protein
LREPLAFVEKSYMDEDGWFHPIHEVIDELKGLTPKLVKTFRGTSKSLLEEYTQKQGFRLDEGVYRDPGFISTSTSRSQAELFRRDLMATVIGVGYPISNKSSFQLEYEVLFPPNTRFQRVKWLNEDHVLLVQVGVEIPDDWDVQGKKSYMVDTTLNLNPLAMSLHPEDLTFGVEIEIRGKDVKGNHVSYGDVENVLGQRFSKWMVESEHCGWEIVSPILKGDDGVDELWRLVNALKDGGFTVDSSCGLHVHIGVEGFHPDKVKAILGAYAAHEERFDELMHVERHQSEYARPVERCFRNMDEVRKQRTITGVGRCQYHRYSKLNVKAFSRHKTIEIRHHHGCLDPDRVDTWVSLLRDFFATVDTWTTDDEIEGLFDNYDWGWDDSLYVEDEDEDEDDEDEDEDDEDENEWDEDETIAFQRFLNNVVLAHVALNFKPHDYLPGSFWVNRAKGIFATLRIDWLHHEPGLYIISIRRRERRVIGFASFSREETLETRAFNYYAGTTDEDSAVNAVKFISQYEE